MDQELHVDPRNATALDRVRLVSQALSEAARRRRVSSRGRRSYASGGFEAQRGAKAFRIGILLSFYLFVAAPSLAAAVYYGFIASDQFIAVADFTVMGGEPVPLDGLGAMTGIPAAAIIQDTQIVTSYLQSRAAVEKLQTLMDVRGIYSDPSIDRWSRLQPNRPIERFVAYWNKMVSTAIKMPSGAVELRVKAFKPEDAARIAQATLTLSEGLINDLNDRMNHDEVANAEEELRRATARLTQTQVSLEQARNDRGILDASKAADALNKLILDSREALLQMQGQYDAQLRFVSASAPQSRALKVKIDATQAQLQELQARLTGTDTVKGQQPLAASMTKFSELNLEHTVAESLFTAATTSLEAARVTAEYKMMYLNTFVKPVAPEQADYPRRGLQMLLISGGSLAVWGLCCAIALTIRNNMA